MVKRGLWKLEIAEASDAIIADLFPSFPLQTDLLQVKLDYFPDGIAWGDLAIDPIDAKLGFYGIEIPLGYFDLDRGDVPAFVPNEPGLLFKVDLLFHGNVDV